MHKLPHKFLHILSIPMLLICVSLSHLSCEQAQQIVNFLDTISDGASCDEDYECLGGRCLKDAQGYPNGYCTTFSCETSGCSGLFSECFRTNIEHTELTACYELCNTDGTCDRAAEGYQCVTLQDTPVCLSTTATNAPVLGSTGSSCSSDAQCTGAGAACLQSFFGGYCATLDCSKNTTCPDGHPCVALNPTGTTDDEKSFACMAGCSTNDSCRFGYTCQDYEGSKICLERDGENRVRNPDGADDGEACVANINCKGNTCIREAKGTHNQTSFPGGLCATRDCTKNEDCHGAQSVCISHDRSTSCRQSCISISDCRSGYICKKHTNGTKYCDSKVETIVSTRGDAHMGLDVQCIQNTKTLTFDLPQETISFYIAPYTTQNTRVRPISLTTPSKNTIHFANNYAFHNINPDILGSLAPMLFPATDSPSLRDAFTSGSYSMKIDTNATEICYYILPQTKEGTTLRINMHIVGVSGLLAANAGSNKDIEQMMRAMRDIYSKLGVSIEIADIIDASKTVADTYRIVRDFNDVFGLVATSTPKNNGIDSNLAINVFLIEDFNISDTPGLLGVSTGIPGMAGLHGTSGSGLVFSTASLGSDNASLGQLMAHEIGHFLGLRHTTEHFGSTHDPISDTPECVLPDLGFLCPDSDNFMFAYSLGGAKQTKTTPGQAFVIRRHPLVR